MSQAAMPAAARVGRAVAAMLGASALVAVTMLLAKTLGQDAAGPPLHPLQVSAGRFFFAFLAVGLVSAWWRPSLSGARWDLHAARSACGWLGVSCMFAAAARMPLAEATAISFLGPLFTMVLALLLLREEVGPRKWLAALISASGAMVLIRPGTEAFQPAALIALAAAALMGLEAIFIKRLSDREPTIRILLINNTIGALVAVSAASLVWRWPTPEQWALLATLGLTMLLAQTLFIQAMRSSSASGVMPVFYTTLLFATLYDFWAFGAVPDRVAALGAALILTGTVALSLRSRRMV
ncbi:MAG: DMT family transporter [Pseudomonadota bacterium]